MKYLGFIAVVTLLVSLWFPLRALGENATSKKGRVCLTVLDENGRPTPSMLRLLQKGAEEPLKPERFVNLKPGTRKKKWGQVIKKKPVQLKGRYWCIPPEGFDQEIPVGEWTCILTHGNETIPFWSTFKIEEGEKKEIQVQFERWVDSRTLGWYSGDGHVHAKIQSDEDARNLLAFAKAEDTRLLNVLEMGDITKTYFHQRAFGNEGLVHDPDGFYLVPGQECPRNGGGAPSDPDTVHLGHALAWNLKTHMVRDTERYYIYETMFEGAHEQGALTGHAHVNYNLYKVTRDMSINVPKGKVDFSEIMFVGLNPNHYYEFLNLGFRLTAAAGSDYPFEGSIGQVRTYTYIGKDETFTSDRWFEAFEKGHTFVSSSMMLMFTVEDALPGDEIQVDDNLNLRIRVRAWGHPSYDSPKRLEVVQFGKVIKSIEVDQASEEELTLDFTIPAGSGSWLAARAYGWNDTSAHTSPIWVVREGLRCWDYDNAHKLVQKRMSNLDEIRTEYNTWKTRDPDHPFVKQWPLLEPKIREAETLYHKLLKEAEREAVLRKTRLERCVAHKK